MKKEFLIVVKSVVTICENINKTKSFLNKRIIENNSDKNQF